MNSLTRPHSVAAGCCLALGACVIAGWLPIGSARLFILECWPALLISLAGVGLGGIVLACLGLGRAPARWQIVGGGGIGMGQLALLALGLGVTGHLSRNLWFGILAALAFVGAAVLIRAILAFQRTPDSPPSKDDFIRWLWILAMPALALGIFAASFPPGILWVTEGNGYDVLEYHFGAPREYFDAGRITFLSHNIYSNFPFNVEMLYLLTFVLRGSPHEAAFAAQFLNVMLGAWAIAAAWLAGRTISPNAGHIAGVLTATCPWLAWLCGIAYVENGMMLFIGVALAAFIEATRLDAAPLRPARWMAIAGLAAGLACGCKYTAIPMVAAPLLVAAVAIGMRRKSWLLPGAFALAAALAFAPWAIKNYAFTGNPIFPLARSVFPERSDVWSEDGAARWHEGHLPDPDKRSISGRLTALKTEVVTKGRFGWVFYGAVIAAFAWPLLRYASRAQSNDAGITPIYLTSCLCSVTSLGVWLAATHLQDRFLIPALIPCVILVGVSLNSVRDKHRVWIALVMVMTISAGGLHRTYRLFNDYFDDDLHRKVLGPFSIASVAVSESGTFEPDLLAEALRAGEWSGTDHIPHLLDAIERGGKVLMVGDARAFYFNSKVSYCVVFDRNPLDSAARRYRPRRVLEWLRNEGYTHIYVDWAEMSRLRKSRYGFWKSIDEEFFHKLAEAGLHPMRNFPESPKDGPLRATLFQVPTGLK